MSATPAEPGCATRFADAYATHWAPLRRRAFALSHDSSAADDITQEAFVRLLTATREGWWPDNLGGWLNRVATNLSVSRGRRDAVAAGWLVRAGIEQRQIHRNDEGSPEDLCIDRDRLRATIHALELLDADAQTALRLAGRGVSRAEIASQLGRSEAATRTLICRARAALRTQVGVDAFDSEQFGASR